MTVVVLLLPRALVLAPRSSRRKLILTRNFMSAHTRWARVFVRLNQRVLQVGRNERHYKRQLSGCAFDCKRIRRVLQRRIAHMLGHNWGGQLHAMCPRGDFVFRLFTPLFRPIVRLTVPCYISPGEQTLMVWILI